MEHLLLAPAFLLNARGVPVKNLEDGQGLFGLGKFVRQMQRGRQRHHGVEADVILAAEGPGIRERGCRDETPEIGA